ncbi:NAD(P)/FAD-dependent oxidoreductase [Burkholderia ubonensis]|uniref:FAD dependent oxidoreductase domain-containing protein n=1 Tax=Burkholderia ubonensis subsp. mesacidophila TaxID=265293 RepID=A0A2A4FGU8_9BURK|nr:FAD-dependent oxidoreductase [Burkholderia ubonensis]PCE31646.1 hypothetical protein BZL54_14235 [Burkholderia ubonensis subsp. mesacidophila]
MTRAADEIVVVGAGIVGASIAYHLASRGARVTLVERHEPACGATGSAFGWINPTADGAPAVAAVRARAVAEYRRLERELGRPLVNWSGALTYGVDEGAAPHQDARVDWLDREQVGRLEPNLLDLPARARYARDEGTLEPAEATRVLVEHACAHGAVYRGNSDVRSLCVDGARIVGVRTETEELRADTVILAAGAQTAALAATAGIVLPLRASPAIRLRLAARRGLVRTLVSNAEMEVREAADGSLVAAEDYVDASGPNGPDAIAERALGTVRRALRGAGDAVLTEVAVGWRPMPEDGVPLIGRCPGVPGLYVAAMHSGVTLAAAVGRLVSEAVMQGATPDELVALAPRQAG